MAFATKQRRRLLLRPSCFREHVILPVSLGLAKHQGKLFLQDVGDPASAKYIQNENCGTQGWKGL